MKKLKNLFFGDTTRLVVSALTVFFAVFCVFPERGFVASLPLLVLAGLSLPLFYEKSHFLIPVAALSSVLLALMLTDSFDAQIFYAVVPTLFYTASYFVTRLLKLFRDPQKRIGALCGVFGAVITLAMYFVVFGNPVALQEKTLEAENLYTARYPKETFTLQNAYYDPIARAYSVEFEVADGVLFVAKEGEDSYLNLIQTRAAALQKSGLLTLLHEKFAEDGNYLVKIKCPALSPEEVCDYKLGDAPEEWLKQNEITLEFDSSIAVGSPDAKAAFAQRIRRYVSYLNESGFPYASITFRGGEQEKPVYELIATPTTPIDELVAPNVTDLTR
ncbi:MAG: hypothetical protein IKT43_04095 [Clostridia bacterium]|nr:hypothetical protein [Clostridia bacterium]